MTCPDNQTKNASGLCPFPKLELNVFNTGGSYNDYIQKLQNTLLAKPCDYMNCGPIVTELANNKSIQNIIDKPCDYTKCGPIVTEIANNKNIQNILNKPCNYIDCKSSINNLLSNLPIIIKLFVIIIFIYLIISIIYNITNLTKFIIKLIK